MKRYLILWSVLILNIIFSPLFLPNGGLVGDIQHYVRMAYYFPDVKWTLYPLGYPLLLKAFYYLTSDYYWAGRLINILCFVGIGLWAYIKKFHFKETVILLCTKIFVTSYFNILSEAPFLFLMYFLFYFLHQYFFNKSGKALVYGGSLIMIALFTVRYSAAYIYFALAVYYVFYYVKVIKVTQQKFFSDSYFRFLLVSGVGIGAYILYNYVGFGDFMGERFRNPSELKPFTEKFYLDVLGLFSAFNPVFGIKALTFTHTSVITESIFFVINVLVIVFFIKLSQRYFAQKNSSHFYSLIIFVGLCYLMLMFLSSFYQGVDGMDMRMLCEASFCFFYVLIFLYYQQKKNEKIIFSLALFSLAFNTVYTVKDPKLFLQQKDRVERIAGQNIKDKLYFVNDTAGKEELSTYKLPIINKEIKHAHPASQSGFVNAYIITTKYPQIKNIGTTDTVKNKNTVIYNSVINAK